MCGGEIVGEKWKFSFQGALTSTVVHVVVAHQPAAAIIYESIHSGALNGRVDSLECMLERGQPG